MSKSVIRRLLLGASGMLVLSAVSPAAAAPNLTAQSVQSASRPISVQLDNAPISLAIPPLLVNGKLMLPVKGLFEKLGAIFRLGHGVLSAVKGSITVEAKLNSTKAKNGQISVILPSPPVVLNGRIYVPARFIELLLDKDVTYDSVDKLVKIGFSAARMFQFQKLLIEAARSGDTAVIELMLSRGVDVNRKLIDYYLDNTALDYAIEYNRTEAAKLLLEHGGTYQKEEAVSVVFAQNSELLKQLLDHGLDPNLVANGSSILATASGVTGSVQSDGSEVDIMPNIKLVNLLLDYGADPSQDDSLSNAVQAQNYEIIQALLRHGADPYRADSFGTTPYERAQYYGTPSWMTLEPIRDIPVLSFRSIDGNSVKAGTLFLADQPGFKGKVLNWTNGQVYFDFPDGDYTLQGVQLADYSCLFPSGTKAKIAQGKLIPDTLQLPAANVTAILEGASVEQQNGHFWLQKKGGNGQFIPVEVKDGKLQLSLPSGVYDFGDYLPQGGAALKGNTEVTVPMDGSTQQITIDIAGYHAEVAQ